MTGRYAVLFLDNGYNQKLRVCEFQIYSTLPQGLPIYLFHIFHIVAHVPYIFIYRILPNKGVGFLQTKVAPLLGEAPLIGILRYVFY